MKKILLLPFILLLLVSFSHAELITDGLTITAPCGETQFEVLNQADYNYLIYNECQEWRFPRILTNIKTTFIDNGLNTKVIPINIAEMNQNGTPSDYSDDYPVKTIAISSINVVPEWNANTKELSWNFYFDTADADIILYYTIKDNAGKWGLEIYNWDFANQTNYIRLRNQIFSGGNFVDFDCSDFEETRECSFLDSEDSEFSTLYFDYPENDGQTYDGSVWYLQQGQNHNLYQDLGRGEEIILDPTITTEIINIGFINTNNKPQCAILDSNMFCVGQFDTKALKLTTATLPTLTDWTLSDWNFLPEPGQQIIHPLMVTNGDNIHISYIWSSSSEDRNIVLQTASSAYLELGSWDNVWTGSAGTKKQNGTLDVNSSGWVISAYGVEGSQNHYMSWCEDCTTQENVSNIQTIAIPDVKPIPTLLSGLFIDDNIYVVLTDNDCKIGVYNRSTDDKDTGSFSNDAFNCNYSALKVANDRLYVNYRNATTNIGYITYVDTDKNIADISLWSTPIQISSNFPQSFSMAFIDRESSTDFNSLVITYSESGSTASDNNRFVGYKLFSTETNTFTNDFTIVDENIEDYSESAYTDIYYDYTRNNVYILYQDSNTNNYNPGVYISIITVGLSGYLTADFNYTLGDVTDLNVLYSFYNDSTYTDVNEFTYQWDVNDTIFSINENMNRSLTLGNDYNICLEVTGTAFDGNPISDQECKTISVSYGSLTMSFVDENTSVALTNVTATFNGTDYDTNSDGMIEISMAGISRGLYTISASDATHPARTFTFDLNILSVIDANVVLLKTTKGKDIEFKFYGNDETTILDDANISIKNTTANKYAYIMATTDSSGKATFFLNPNDYAYEFEIEDNTGTFTYTSGIIAVKRPKNIIDLNIITPFNIIMNGITSLTVNSLTADINFNVFTNLIIPYLFLVDANSGLYYITSGSFSLIGDENLEDYQPYLVPVDTDDGIEVSIYTIDNQHNRKSLPGVLIELYTDIEGTEILVESKVSDGTGKAIMHFAKNRAYILKAYYEGELKLSINIENPASNIFLYIETGEFEEFEAMGLVQIIWYYTTSNLIPTDGIVTLRQTIIPIAVTVGDVNVTISHKGVVISTETFTLNTSNDTNITYDVNITGLNQYIPLVVKLKIYDTSGNLIPATDGIYTFIADTIWQSTISNLKTGFGLLATTLIMIILCIYLMGLLSVYRVGQDNNWLFILPMILLGLGAFLGLIDMIGWFLGSLFALSIAIWRVRE